MGGSGQAGSPVAAQRCLRRLLRTLSGEQKIVFNSLIHCGGSKHRGCVLSMCELL